MSYAASIHNRRGYFVFLDAVVSYANMQRQSAIKALKAIVYAGIYGGLLMPLMFVPVVIFPFVFSKLIFFQVLIGLTFPAYAILAWVEPKYRPRWSWLYAAIGAYFVALLLSVIFAVDPVKAWWGNQERMNGLFTLLHFFMWLTMTVSLIKTWAQWRNLLNFQIILGVVMACVALLQKPFPNLLLFPASGRVGGLLDNPIYMGAYQIFVLFFLALLWLKTKSNGWRAWYVIAFIASLSALGAAGSRGPFMGLIFGVVLSAITVGVLHQSKKVRMGVIGAIAAVSIFYVGMVTVGVKTDAFKAFSKASPTVAHMFVLDTGTAGRFIAWRIAWDGFLQRPITGWGLDDFHILFNRNYNPQSLRSGYYETWFDRAHNTVMDVLSMTGIIGFLTFAGMWVMMYVTVFKARKRGYIDIPTTAILVGLPAGYFLQNIFVFDHPAAFSMSFLLYAFVVCIGFPAFAGGAEHEAQDKPTATNPVPWITFGIVQAGFILLVYLTSALPAYASYLTIKGNNMFMQGNLNGWYALAKQAGSIQTPYLDEQTFLNARNIITLADSGKMTSWPQWKDMVNLTKDISERHLVSHGVNAHPLFIYANMLQSVGRATSDPQLYAQAEEVFKRAVNESPKRQQILFSYGRLLVELGRMDEAMDQFMKAAQYDEGVGESWWYVGVSYWYDQGKPEEGAPYIVKAMTAIRPYSMRSGQDALLVAQAADMTGNKELLKSMMDSLPGLPAAPSAVYIQIAQAMENQGLIEERNLILGAVIRMDATVKTQLQPLIDGKAKTIEESLKMAAAATTTAKAAPTPAPEGLTVQQAEPVVQTAEPANSGPRR